MFKFSSQKALHLIRFILACLLLFASVQSKAQFLYSKGALIESIVDEQYLTAGSDTNLWDVGEILPIISQNSRIGVFAFAEIQNIKKRGRGDYELRLKLLRQSRKFMIQKGDLVKKLDVTTTNKEFIGSTDLIIKKSELPVSSKYRPLFYQGLSIGETAQTLYEDEVLINFLSNSFYGVTDWFSVGSLLTANVLGSPNVSFKAKFWDTDSATLSSGLSFVRLVKEDQATLNFNFYWDSISSDTLISHTFISLSLINWDGAEEVTSIKSFGSSSFQTGYELILSDWDRVLIGPSYNFVSKGLGGYLSYVWIYDRMHIQASINATDVTKFRLDPTDGYFGFVDIYWRF